MKRLGKSQVQVWSKLLVLMTIQDANIVAMNPQLVAWLCGDGIELCTVDLWLL